MHKENKMINYCGGFFSFCNGCINDLMSQLLIRKKRKKKKGKEIKKMLQECSGLGGQTLWS
jgi:hypothetical protein